MKKLALIIAIALLISCDRPINYFVNVNSLSGKKDTVNLSDVSDSLKKYEVYNVVISKKIKGETIKIGDYFLLEYGFDTYKWKVTELSESGVYAIRNTGYDEIKFFSNYKMHDSSFKKMYK